MGVEDEQPGVFAGGVAPVVGEGEDLAGLLGLGDLGVGVDHLGAGVVLGEEGEHGAGALGAARHVVFSSAVCSPWWRMAWKSRSPRGPPVRERPQGGAERGTARGRGGGGEGAAGERRAGREEGEPANQRERAGGGDVERGERRRRWGRSARGAGRGGGGGGRRGAGRAGGANHPGRAEREERGRRRKRSGVLGDQLAVAGPIASMQPARLGRRRGGDRRRRRRRSASRGAGVGEQLGDRGARQRRARGAQRAFDLPQRAALGAQRQRDAAGAVLLGCWRGPGREDANRLRRPARQSRTSVSTVATVYPKRSATRAADSPSTKYARSAS